MLFAAEKISGPAGVTAPASEKPLREPLVAVLNGVLGDRLFAQQNPLAVPMQLRCSGQPLCSGAKSVADVVPAPSSTLLLQIHGICMYEGQWGSETHDPGAVLADALDATPLSLRYNSGRHVSENGRELARALNDLVEVWPRPVRRIVIVAHSMGGLVGRSALHYAAEAGYAWPTLDVSLVTLGTPHHGAPLERLGNMVDALLGATRYAAPFARIGRIRSAGVTDLRFGNVRDEDWREGNRFRWTSDARTPLPLPKDVSCYFVAATTGDGTGSFRDRTVGDGLVTLESALGRHPHPALDLRLPAERQWIASEMTHFDLLRRPEVTARLIEWLVRSP